jgi:hypothetical protein
MPIRHAIWTVSTQPVQLTASSLNDEQLLEKMIVAEPRIVSDELMLIGRQEATGFNGRIDLLAIAPDGSLVLIELKRDRTPREVVAQALDYATWVDKLKPEDITAIYERFAPKKSLLEDFRNQFKQPLEEDTLNQNHQIIIVAASLDDSTERIINYLNQRDIQINALCFQVVTHGVEQLLSRAWLIDPARTQAIAAISPNAPKEPWNGEFFACFGQSESRSWAEAVKYGFISGGGGAWNSNTLNLLQLGARVWVYAPGFGYVGVGRVKGPREAASSFRVTTLEGEMPVMEILKDGHYQREFISDPEKCEYFVPMQWIQTVPIEKAFGEIGLFANQNTVCRPTTPKWTSTVARLKEYFPRSKDDAANQPTAVGAQVLDGERAA